LTSAATTANPLPASPARAASIVALSARRLVCARDRGHGADYGDGALGGVVQRADDVLGALGIGDGRLRHAETVGRLLAHLLDRSGKLFCPRHGRVHALRRLGRRRRRQRHAAERILGDLPQRCAGQSQRNGSMTLPVAASKPEIAASIAPRP
jgi:hypothetical protein